MRFFLWFMMMTEKCRFLFSFSLSSQCHLSSADSFCTFLVPVAASLYRPFVLIGGFHSSALQFELLPPSPHCLVLSQAPFPCQLELSSSSSPWNTRMGATRVPQKPLSPPLLGAAASSACWKMSGQGCPAQPHQLWLCVSILGPLSLVQLNLSRFSQRLQISALFSSTFLLNFNFWSKARSCWRVLVLWWYLF